MRKRPWLGGCLWLGLCALGVGGLAACERKAAPPVQTTPSPNAAAIEAFRRPAELVAALALHAGDAVAEVGAGGGYLTPYLARAVGPKGEVVATDIDAAALDALRGRVAAAGLFNVKTRLVHAADPGLAPGGFDLVLLAQVDHLLADRVAYLRALAPALKPGGRLAVSNRELYREPLVTAATAAGFEVEEGAVKLPAQYLVILRRR